MATPNLRQTHFHKVSEIADQLHVSDKTVRRWIKRGELRVHQIGRQHRIASDDLIAFIAVRRQ